MKAINTEIVLVTEESIKSTLDMLKERSGFEATSVYIDYDINPNTGDRDLRVSLTLKVAK